MFRGSFCGNQKGERTMLLSRGYLTVQCVMHGAPAPTGVLPSELPVNTCFDGIRTNMSRKGPFECQTDPPPSPAFASKEGHQSGRRKSLASLLLGVLALPALCAAR